MATNQLMDAGAAATGDADDELALRAVAIDDEPALRAAVT